MSCVHLGARRAAGGLRRPHCLPWGITVLAAMVCTHLATAQTLPLTPAIAPIASLAQGAEPLPAAPVLRVSSLPAGAALRIDGRLDEAVWQTAPVLADFQQFLPQPGPLADPAYRTEVRVLVSSDAIVFGIRAFDPRPAEIRAPLLRRDRVQRDQDFVSVLLDAAGDRRSAQFVRVNPRGVIGDGMFIADRTSQVEGNDGDEDFSPDFDVEAATDIDAEGYTVELRWPRTTLRMPHRGMSDARLPWRVLVTRSIPRDASVLVTSAAVPKEALSFLAGLQPLGDVAPIEDAARRAALVVRPTFTWRGERARQEASDGSANASTSRSRASLGVELKWQPRSDWVVDATLNPDFSQVELDTPQLAGNTRFAISVLEKRPFFLESTDVLDLPLQAFYSRSVTDPRAGLRATWRGGRADATALVMRDDGGGVVLLPGAFATGVRAQDSASDVSLWRGRWHGGLAAGSPASLRSDTRNDEIQPEPTNRGPGLRTTVGALLTTRDSADGGRNAVAGLDVLLRPDEGMRLRGRWLASSTRDGALVTGGTPQTHGELWFLAANRRTEGYAINLEWQRTTPRFRNDNGFIEQAGVDRRMAEWVWRLGERNGPGFTAHEFETFVWFEERIALRDATGGTAASAVAPGIAPQMVSRRWHPGIWLTSDPNVEAWLHAVVDAERVRPSGRLHPVRGMAGQFGINPAPWFTRLQVEAQWGERVDVDADRVGRGSVWTVDAQWRAELPFGWGSGWGGARNPTSPDRPARPWGLEVKQRWQQGQVDAPAGGRALTDRTWQVLAVLHLSERDSVRTIWQAARTLRVSEPAAGLEGFDDRSHVRSVVAQRRFSAGRHFAVGWVGERGQSPGSVVRLRRQDEVFVKATIDW